MTMNNDVSIGRSWELSVTGQDSAMWRMLPGRSYHHLLSLVCIAAVMFIQFIVPILLIKHVITFCSLVNHYLLPSRSRARCLSPYQLMVLLFIFHGKFSVCIIIRVSCSRPGPQLSKFRLKTTHRPTLARPAGEIILDNDMRVRTFMGALKTKRI